MIAPSVDPLECNQHVCVVFPSVFISSLSSNVLLSDLQRTLKYGKILHTVSLASILLKKQSIGPHSTGMLSPLNPPTALNFRLLWRNEMGKLITEAKMPV